jgi:glycoprotein-N-acetylgalactosamine 3-beta-galactosyltransferase
MENLKTYLANSNIQPDKPTILGRRYASPRYRNLLHKNTYFNHSSNRAFGKRFVQKVNKNKPVFYNYGGAGYAMNPAYLQKVVSVLSSADTIRDSQPPEDQALGVVMAYQDIWPKTTLDEMGRNRFHMEAPWTMYDPPENDLRRFNQAHKAAGIWKPGTDCCAPESITFHHLSPKAMLDLHHQLHYRCRVNE